VIRFTEKDDSIIFTVRVVPRAKTSEIIGEMEGALKVKINAPPVDGAANAELIRVLSKTFDVAKSAIEIVKGQTSKTKQIKINGLTAANLPDSKSA
jgi:uncharacterized protein